MASVYIKTYGCQMNERDSEAVAAQLVAKGYTLAATERAADVAWLNTLRCVTTMVHCRRELHCQSCRCRLFPPVNLKTAHGGG